jgi:hypothetical protein
MILVVLNGPAEAGKGTLSDILTAVYDVSVLNYSSITRAKQVAEYGWGWQGDKAPESRALLGKIKGLLIEYGDLPFNDVIQTARQAAVENIDIMITDVREPSEIKKLAGFFTQDDHRCLTIRIANTKKEEEAFKHLDIADNQYHLYAYDHTINNNGDLIDFQKNITAVFDQYIKE